LRPEHSVYPPKRKNIMMKLLLLIATTTALIDVVVAEARSNNLQQNHRMLKKDNVDWEKQDDFYWNAFAAELERKQDEFDWNAFAAELASKGGALSAQPTVSPKPTSKPSVSPTQVNYSGLLARAVVIALVTVFAFTIALIGFITVRKKRAPAADGHL
jgi:hypothetical protein